jgi:oligopeptide/dipeptide ABC transporter ATP-binding protein
VPRLDSDKGAPLTPIAGEIPDLTDLPDGCAFNPRCPWAVERCFTDDPELEEISTGKQVACFEHASVALHD